MIDIGLKCYKKMKPNELKEGKTPVELGTPLSSISIDLTEGCSLRCTYCFTNLETKNKKNNNKLSLKIGKEIIDWFLKDSTSGTIEDIKKRKQPLNIDWWGGEPFLEFSLMKNLTKYAQDKAKEAGKEIKFGGTTNIVSLTEEKVNWIINNNAHFLLSCDGRGERNKERPFPNGKNSWDVMRKKLSMIMRVYKKHKVPFMPKIRLTATPSTLKGIASDLIYFHEQDWGEIFFSENHDAEWSENDFKVFKDELNQISEYRINSLSKGKFLTTKFFDDPVKNIFANSMSDKKIPANGPGWSCGAGKTFMGASVEGALYICHRTNKHDTLNKVWHDKENCLGSIYEGITNIKKYKELQELKVPALIENSPLSHCKDCPIELTCLGGCIASLIDSTGSPSGKHAIYCTIRMTYYDIISEEIKKVILSGKLKEYLHIIGVKLGANKFTPQGSEFHCTCNESYYTSLVRNYKHFLDKKELDGVLEPQKLDEAYMLQFISLIAENSLKEVVGKGYNKQGCLCNNGSFNDNGAEEKIKNLTSEEVKGLVEIFQKFLERSQ